MAATSTYPESPLRAPFFRASVLCLAMLIPLYGIAADEKSAASVAADVNAQLALTEDEKQWIKDNLLVRYTGDPNWLSFDTVDAGSRYANIVADYIMNETFFVAEDKPLLQSIVGKTLGACRRPNERRS